MKTLTKFQVASIKRSAQNVSTLISKRDKLQEKKAKIDAELSSILATISAFEEPVKVMTGGYTSEELIDKIVTKYTDKSGKEQTKVEWKLKEQFKDGEIPEKEETTESKIDNVLSGGASVNTPSEPTPDEFFQKTNDIYPNNTVTI